jgi:hypothetical protein
VRFIATSDLNRLVEGVGERGAKWIDLAVGEEEVERMEVGRNFHPHHFAEMEAESDPLSPT